MKKSEAVQHYGSERKISRVLGISHQAVNAWGEVVPIKKAREIQLHTNHKLGTVAICGCLNVEDYL